MSHHLENHYKLQVVDKLLWLLLSEESNELFTSCASPFHESQ